MDNYQADFKLQNEQWKTSFKYSVTNKNGMRKNFQLSN